MNFNCTSNDLSCQRIILNGLSFLRKIIQDVSHKNQISADKVIGQFSKSLCSLWLMCTHAAAAVEMKIPGNKIAYRIIHDSVTRIVQVRDEIQQHIIALNF